MDLLTPTKEVSSGNFFSYMDLLTSTKEVSSGNFFSYMDLSTPTKRSHVKVSLSNGKDSTTSAEKVKLN